MNLSRALRNFSLQIWTICRIDKPLQYLLKAVTDLSWCHREMTWHDLVSLGSLIFICLFETLPKFQCSSELIVFRRLIFRFSQFLSDYQSEFQRSCESVIGDNLLHSICNLMDASCSHHLEIIAAERNFYNLLQFHRKADGDSNSFNTHPLIRPVAMRCDAGRT